MTPSNERAALVAAEEEGKVVEYFDGVVWVPKTIGLWAFGQCQYRIAPKPLEYWAVYCDKCEVCRLDTRAGAEETLRKLNLGYTIHHMREVMP